VSRLSRLALHHIRELTALSIGTIFPNFGTLVSLIGSIGSSSLAFIFPPLFFLKLRWNTMHPALKGLNITYAVLGLAAGILGTVQTTISIIQGDDGC